MKFTRDVLIRTIKTFIQAFLGALIPALVTALRATPGSWADVLPWIGSILTPQLILGTCLAAGICAIWNGLTSGGSDGGK